VSERPKEHASKACEVQASQGSNPCATAKADVGHSPTDTILGDADVVLEPPRIVVLSMIFCAKSLTQAVQAGHARITTGDLERATTWFDYFDPPNPNPITLSDR
jgi:hypothetical protein